MSERIDLSFHSSYELEGSDVKGVEIDELQGYGGKFITVDGKRYTIAAARVLHLFAADNDVSVVPFHREHCDDGSFVSRTEVFYPLSGKVRIVHEITPDNDCKAAGIDCALGETVIEGTIPVVEMDGSEYALIGSSEGDYPAFVVIGAETGQEYTSHAQVIVEPHAVHGTITAVDLNEDQYYFALKLDEIIDEE